MSTGSGSYQKLEDMSMNNMWKKIGAFIQNVHMLFTKLPDYMADLLTQEKKEMFPGVSCEGKLWET